MKKNLSKIKVAPLYLVLSGINNSGVSMRVIPLTRAVKKNQEWQYPGEGGTKRVPVKSLNIVDASDFKNPNVTKKMFKGYCLKTGISKMMDMLEVSHKKPLSKSAMKAIVPVVVAKTKTPAVVKSTKPTVKKSKEPSIVDIGLAKNFPKKDMEDIIAVKEFLSGNKNKFAVIYKRYYPIINYKFATNLKYDKDLADDLTADFFIKVMDKLDSYKPEYTFNSWISRVAKNFFIDYTRKGRLETVSIDAGVSSEKMNNEDIENVVLMGRDESALSGEQIMIDAEKVEYMRKAIEKLDEKSKTVINMLYFEEKSYIEISKETGMVLNTVKGVILRAKEKLKGIILADKNIPQAVMA